VYQASRRNTMASRWNAANAWDTVTGSGTAPHGCDDGAGCSLCEHENQLACRLQHPNIMNTLYTARTQNDPKRQRFDQQDPLLLTVGQNIVTRGHRGHKMRYNS
jgi:hypothetical protein